MRHIKVLTLIQQKSNNIKKIIAENERGIRKCDVTFYTILIHDNRVDDKMKRFSISESCIFQLVKPKKISIPHWNRFGLWTLGQHC